MDTAREELPDTMAAVKLSAMEISDLTTELTDFGQEITQGVRSSTRAVRSVEQGLRGLTTMPSSSASLQGMEYSPYTEADSGALSVGRNARGMKEDNKRCFGADSYFARSGTKTATGDNALQDLPKECIVKDEGTPQDKKFVTAVQIATPSATLQMSGDEKSRVKDAENSAASLMIRALQ
ncbi:hypothetical protein KIW84_020541 [Lathyrus oleraceus]|uniref:Uncharacterized protein n=1 Tax=Pisum sativum TaxID=3888 RepID=A0A9D5B2Q7_PEA|nr:hypothetical protein KIW84_020541 [Pisum sativum]